jgi:hypothetical protein
MPYSPATAGTFLLPAAPGKIAVPAAAKTTLTDITNAALLVPSMTSSRQYFTNIFVQQIGTVIAGKVQLWVYDGSVAWAIDEAAVAALTYSTTSVPTKISFSNWSATNPLMLEFGNSLYVSTSVAQTAGVLIAHAQGGKYL